jgi:hypothetical protein
MIVEGTFLMQFQLSLGFFPFEPISRTNKSFIGPAIFFQLIAKNQTLVESCNKFSSVTKEPT